MEIPHNADVGDVLCYEEGGERKYFMVVESRDGQAILTPITEREAMFEIEAKRRQVRLNMLCADAIQRRN